MVSDRSRGAGVMQEGSAPGQAFGRSLSKIGIYFLSGIA